MNKKQIIEITEKYSQKCSDNNEPGHDFSHVLRVRKMAKKLAKTTQNDGFLVEMLALLHDIEDYKLNSNNSVKAFLDSIEIDNEYKAKILHILPFMSFSKYPKLPDDFPIEGKIVVDADRLDAIGAIGVARAFSYGGSHRRKMYGSDDSTIKHFDEKLLVLDQYLHFDESKRIAEKRMKFIKDFYDEFLMEVNDETR